MNTVRSELLVKFHRATWRHESECSILQCILCLTPKNGAYFFIFLLLSRLNALTSSALGCTLLWRTVTLDLCSHHKSSERKQPLMLGRAISQAVSHRLLTAAARVRTQVGSCGICGGQSGTGAGFLRVLRFPLPILILPTAPHSSGAGTIGQLVAEVPSGLSPTASQETKRKGN
jgi:hypothetical protein